MLGGVFRGQLVLESQICGLKRGQHKSFGQNVVFRIQQGHVQCGGDHDNAVEQNVLVLGQRIGHLYGPQAAIAFPRKVAGGGQAFVGIGQS